MDNLQEPTLGTPVILTGMPRSGTTMLGDFARRYLDVAAVNEGPFEIWLAKCQINEESLRDDRKLDEFLDAFAHHQYFRLLYNSDKLPCKHIVQELRKRLASRTIVAIAYATLQLTKDFLGGSVQGHEDPLLIDDLGAVLSVIPNCRIVHILRDPRDAAASILRFPWGANNVCVYAKEWNRKVTQARKVGHSLGTDRYLEIRYEDILAHPKVKMAELMTFVHSQVNEEKLQSFVEEMEKNPRRGNSQKWKTLLNEKQIRVVESAAGSQMQLVGYDLAYAEGRLHWPESAFWTIHHRTLQVWRIVAGKLSTNGAAKTSLRSEEQAYPRG